MGKRRSVVGAGGVGGSKRRGVVVRRFFDLKCWRGAGDGLVEEGAVAFAGELAEDGEVGGDEGEGGPGGDVVGVARLVVGVE